MKNLLLASVALLLFTACGNNVDVAVDNPTSTPIMVTIDTLTFEVPAEEVVWVEMGKGSHTVKLEGQDDVAFDFSQSAYMLNPTMSEYLVVKEFYGDQASYANYELASSINKKTVNFMGMELEGDYSVVNQLVNPVTWEIGPRESLPEVVEVEAGQSYTTVSKLMSGQEFWQQVMQAAQDMPSEEAAQ